MRVSERGREVQEVRTGGSWVTESSLCWCQGVERERERDYRLQTTDSVCVCVCVGV